MAVRYHYQVQQCHHCYSCAFLSLGEKHTHKQTPARTCTEASHITGSYLAVQIEQVKGVDAHLHFDLGRVDVLQGGIKTHGDASITLLPLTKKKLCKWPRLIHKSLHSTLGLCYSERFDSLPSLSWALTTMLCPSLLCLFTSSATPSSPAPQTLTAFISSLLRLTHIGVCRTKGLFTDPGEAQGEPLKLQLPGAISTKRCWKSLIVHSALTDSNNNSFMVLIRVNLRSKYGQIKR